MSQKLTSIKLSATFCLSALAVKPDNREGTTAIRIATIPLER